MPPPSTQIPQRSTWPLPHLHDIGAVHNQTTRVCTGSEPDSTGVTCLCPLRMADTPSFPDAMPCHLPPPLFALCPQFEAGVFGPYSAIHHCRIFCSSGYSLLHGHRCSIANPVPLNAPSIGHSGLLSPVSPLEAAILSGKLFALIVSFPPCLRTGRMK